MYITLMPPCALNVREGGANIFNGVFMVALTIAIPDTVDLLSHVTCLACKSPTTINPSGARALCVRMKLATSSLLHLGLRYVPEIQVLYPI